MTILLLLLLPILLTFAVMLFSRGKITWWEAGSCIAASFLVVTIGLYGAAESRTSDTEILNGQVISKTSPHVTCSHTYSCNPHSVSESYSVWVPTAYTDTTPAVRYLTIKGSGGGGRGAMSSSGSRSYSGGGSGSGRGALGGGSRSYSSGGSRSQQSRPSGHYENRTRTVTKWDTCRYHPYDIEYDLRTSFGDTFSIPSADPQGLQPPQRWTEAYVSEPAAKEHEYANYIKANPDSVLRRFSGADKFKSLIPAYPRVNDLYRVSYFHALGIAVPNASAYEKGLAEINRDLGAKKQVNVQMFVVNTADPSYQYALEHEWVGGKKNDLLVIVGVQGTTIGGDAADYPNVNWVRVSSWSPAADLKVELRDELLSMGTLQNHDKVLAAIRTHTDKQFKRMHMKAYQYLMLAYEPSLSTLLWLELLSLALAGGILWWSWRNQFMSKVPLEKAFPLN